MTTDRELLEMAASLDGKVLSFDGPAVWVVHGGERVELWNPLESNDHAFKLAVKWGVSIEFGSCADDAPLVRAKWSDGSVVFPWAARFPDGCAATRRVIVSALAEIGRQMSAEGAMEVTR